ncbi:hypothetical protein [Microtetraspora malaysiensis]|uniref:Uncharacterized protein n=1 Tax=Microtetraspora malaysiensis TaxID=161358 RepID=A0ABW6T2U5_9ACTN
MIMEDSARSGPGRACRYWLMAVSSVALIVVIRVHLAGHNAPEKTSRSVVTPVEEDDVSNAKIIDKEQRVDVDTFDQKDSPLWPLIEEFRSAAPQNDSAATDSKEE